MARRRRKTVEQFLGQAGFRIEGTGGGCEAYGLTRDPRVAGKGVDFLVTIARDGCYVPKNFREAVALGVYCHGQQVASIQFRNVRELRESLAKGDYDFFDRIRGRR